MFTQPWFPTEKYASSGRALASPPPSPAPAPSNPPLPKPPSPRASAARRRVSCAAAKRGGAIVSGRETARSRSRDGGEIPVARRRRDPGVARRRRDPGRGAGAARRRAPRLGREPARVARPAAVVPAAARDRVGHDDVLFSRTRSAAVTSLTRRRGEDARTHTHPHTHPPQPPSSYSARRVWFCGGASPLCTSPCASPCAIPALALH